MIFVGIVKWTNNDRNGNAIAGVGPLVEVLPENWRQIDALEEFPSQGQAFWPPPASSAMVHALYFCNREPNGKHKDQFRVSDPRPAVEVFDLRDVGGPREVRNILSQGIDRPGFHEGHALIWCRPDVLVGPLRLRRRDDGLFTFEHANPHEISCFSESGLGRVRSVHDGQYARLILPRPFGERAFGAPTGSVDWGEDWEVVRRALRHAVDRCRHDPDVSRLTKRLIDEAATAVTAGRGRSALPLECYRLERAREICADADHAIQLAADLATCLLEHPAVANELERVRGEVRAATEAAVRNELRVALAAAQEEHGRLMQQNDSARQEFARLQAELDTARQRVSQVEAEADKLASSVEAAVTSRIAEVMAQPARLLAEVSIVRSFLQGQGASSQHASNLRPNNPALNWTAAASRLTDGQAVRSALVRAFRALGLEPTQAIRIHAAVIAGLLPIVTGSGALSALRAYAQVICGGRIVVIHVTPDMLRPPSVDSTELLTNAAAATRSVAGSSLVVFEGVNRSATEAYLLPFLQALEEGPLDPSASTLPPPSLRWAATAVSGAATVPVCRDLWARAVVLHVDRRDRGTGLVPSPTEVDIAGGEFGSAPVPETVIEDVLAECAWSSEIEGCLRGFSRALSCFESDRQAVTRALVEGVLLPFIVTAPDQEFRVNSLTGVRALLGSTFDQAGLAELERRLRWRLA